MTKDLYGVHGRIDLDALARRESEQIEWKDEVADIDDVVRTLSAFANDSANLGGGYVVCGASERRDTDGFPILAREGLTASRLREVEDKVLQRCRDLVFPSIVPLVEELPSSDPERRLLMFIQPATGSVHTVRQAGEVGRVWVRLSRETREARNGVLRDLMVRKGAQAPWDRRVCPGATVGDVDLLALRDALRRMKLYDEDMGVEPLLAPDTPLSALAPSLCVREPLTGVVRPRNFAILLFGRQPQRFIPGAVTLFSIYPGEDRSAPQAARHELVGTLIDQARGLKPLLDAQSYTVFDKTDRAAPNGVTYPPRALEEAMGNALAHRDFELDDPTRITVFDGRIEFVSPGALPLGVSLEALRRGRAGARWRNQALAWVFNRLQLAQAEGQGVPTILRAMREAGCPPPVFEADEVRVVCVLSASPRSAIYAAAARRGGG
jgi:ATP-dependent DNA helicase RecG